MTGATVTAAEFAKDREPKEVLTDIKISTGIKSEMMRQGFQKLYAKINIEVSDGRVLYTGQVDKQSEIIKAVEIAWNQKHVKEVINEIKIAKNSNHFDLVQYTRDSLITSQIKSKTFIDNEIKFVNYNIMTLNDVVYLFGIARSEEELRKVANIAAKIRGVKKVVSHARITGVKSERQADDVLIDDDKSDLIAQDDAEIIEEITSDDNW